MECLNNVSCSSGKHTFISLYNIWYTKKVFKGKTFLKKAWVVTGGRIRFWVNYWWPKVQLACNGAS